MEIHTRLHSQTGNRYGFTASTTNPLLLNVGAGIVADLNSGLSAFESSPSSEGTFRAAS